MLVGVGAGLSVAAAQDLQEARDRINNAQRCIALEHFLETTAAGQDILSHVSMALMRSAEDNLADSRLKAAMSALTDADIPQLVLVSGGAVYEG